MMIQDAGFFNRLDDLADRAASRQIIVPTFFMTPSDQQTAQGWLDKRFIPYLMHGGYAHAERKICLLLPYDRDPETVTISQIESHIGTLKILVKDKQQTLSHRDYLGSLLALGIRRDQIGDILVEGDGATVLIYKSILPLLLNDLQTVGRTVVSPEQRSLNEVQATEKETDQFMVTASSLRLDKLTAEGFKLSRTKAADFIRTGMVQVDWQLCQRPDFEVKVGAVISLRGHGRIRLLRDEGLSRKNRHRLIIERFL